MFGSRKRVFAKKRNTLYAEPLCPYITDSNGYASVSRRPSVKYFENGSASKANRTPLR